MPEFKLQRFRGGYAIAVYDGGCRLSRNKLESSDAAGAAAEFERLVAEAKRPVDPDVNALWEAYREDRAGRRIAENMEWSGKSIIPFFGKKKPADINVNLCRSYIATRRLKGRKNGTIGTELNHLRIVLAWAAKTNLIGKAPPMELPSKPPPRERHLTRDEFNALLDASETHHLRLFLVLAISTAARAGALLELTWDQIDFERGLIYLGQRNALRPRKGRATVPMTNSARAALSSAKRVTRSGFVIEWGGEAVTSVRTALNKAAERAQVKGVSPHVLRHTAAVWMAEAGRPIEEIAQYLGHSDTGTTQRVYARFSPGHLRQSANALELGSVRGFPGTSEDDPERS
jgi:integrase